MLHFSNIKPQRVSDASISTVCFKIGNLLRPAEGAVILLLKECIGLWVAERYEYSQISVDRS